MSVKRGGLQRSRRVLVADRLEYYFASNEIVYRIEDVNGDVQRSDLFDPKSYVHEDVWFKVFLNINRGGHYGKYIATIASLRGQWRLDDARNNGNLNLMREQMQARVLKAIVEAGKNGERVGARVCPSVVWLERVDQCSQVMREISEAGVVFLESISLGHDAPDGERMGISNRLAKGLDVTTDQMVKYGSQMVDRLVREQGYSIWTLLDAKAIEVIRTIGIYLAADGPWITRLELLDDTTQMAQVFTCPDEFESRPVWWMERIYRSHRGRITPVGVRG